MTVQQKNLIDPQTWKLIRRSAACLPLAFAATQASVHGQQPVDVQHGPREAGIWVFHHEFALGTSLELKVRAATAIETGRAEQAALAEFDRQDNILRWLHIYLSMGSFALVLFFAATGLTLNHPTGLPAGAPPWNGTVSQTKPCCECRTPTVQTSWAL